MFEAQEVNLKDLNVETLEDATKIAREVSEVGKLLRANVVAYETELAAIEEQAKAVKERYEAIINPLKEDIELYNSKLMAYHSSTIANATDSEKSKLTSIKLPYGVTLASRAKPPALVVNDDKKYLAFAKENELVETKETVKWAQMKKNLKINDDGIVSYDGEIVDFITVEEQERVFDVKWD